MKFPSKAKSVRCVGPSAALLVGASLIAAQWLAGAAPAAADPPELPGTWVTVVASVQQLAIGPMATFLVTLDGATPDATYAVSDCALNPNGSTSCVSDPKQDQITTDASGDASATLTFAGGGDSYIVKIVNVANPSDAFTVGLTVLDPGV